MKALSLLQPWASLVVLGYKTIETRSWNTKYRGPLLIHASAGKNMGMPKDMHNDFLATVYNRYAPKAPAFVDLPFGKIIGRVDLIGIMDTEEWMNEFRHGFPNGKREFNLGDYSTGRWGWELKNPRAFTNPIPAKGQLGIWEYNIENAEII